MKPNLALLAATAVGALVTISAAGAIRPLFEDPPIMADSGDAPDNARYVLASNDADRGERTDRMRQRAHDDDDDDDDEDEDDDDEGDEEDEDDDKEAGSAVIPAPAGMVAPPANGLFADGAVQGDAAPPHAAADRGAPEPAQAGEAGAPVKHLFGSSAPPKVQVN
jgi:hypothetical protein